MSLASLFAEKVSGDFVNGAIALRLGNFEVLLIARLYCSTEMAICDKSLSFLKLRYCRESPAANWRHQWKLRFEVEEVIRDGNLLCSDCLGWKVQSADICHGDQIINLAYEPF